MAEKRVLKLCRLLGDSTRLRIYKMVKSRPMGTTVKEVAAEIDLHPNVARLHLSKLEQESLVFSKTLPSRAKGRPQRLYIPGNGTVEISIPKRDYSLLCSLLLEVVGCGPETSKRVHEIGVKVGRRLVNGDKGGRTEVILSALQRLGCEPELSGANGNQLEIHTGNCIFKDMVDLNPAVVCHFHHAITEGIASEVANAPATVSLGDYRCRQVVRILDEQH